jgi:hypothetical protein
MGKMQQFDGALAFAILLADLRLVIGGGSSKFLA